MAGAGGYVARWSATRSILRHLRAVLAQLANALRSGGRKRSVGPASRCRGRGLLGRQLTMLAAVGGIAEQRSLAAAGAAVYEAGGTVVGALWGSLFFAMGGSCSLTPARSEETRRSGHVAERSLTRPRASLPHTPSPAPPRTPSPASDTRPAPRCAAPAPPPPGRRPPSTPPRPLARAVAPPHARRHHRCTIGYLSNSRCCLIRVHP